MLLALPQIFVSQTAASPVGVRRELIQFVVTAEVHYGIARRAFRGDSNVSAAQVNAAMVAQINSLPTLRLPRDSGVRAGHPVNAIDLLVVAGDIANRAEAGVQPGARSWMQCRTGFIDALRLRDAAGRRTRLLLLAGNHDVSNAIGFYRQMTPARDARAAAEIFNLMLRPAVRRTGVTYDYARDRIHYSIDVGNVHFAVVNIWPDCAERAWLAHDLARVAPSTPVLLFAHDSPAGDAKHFTNPRGTHDINATDRFENLLTERDRAARVCGVRACPFEHQGVFSRAQ